VIVTPRIAARIAGLIFGGVVLQLAFFSRISVLGTSPDVTPVLVVCLGLLGGSLAGAVAGFSTGLLIDTLQYQTLGATSLALILVGYVAGRYRESFERYSTLTLASLGAGLTVLAVVAFSMIQLMLGVEAELSALIVRDTLLKALYNLLLTVPVYAGVRRALRPALIDDTAGPGPMVAPATGS
jgi:rod shape-determining protein MreD